MTGRRALNCMVTCLITVTLPSVAAAVDFPLRKKSQKKITGVQQASANSASNAVVAEVNGSPITRAELAEELIETHGRKQLELMIHRKVILEACKAANKQVTNEEVIADVNETLQKLNVKRSEFEERILARRGLTYKQYVRDTVWPALALKKLVEGTVEVTQEEMKKAFIANYGEKVDVRMLVVHEKRKAFELWEAANKIEDEQKRLEAFEEMCKTYSIDQASRPYAGRAIINHHMNAPAIEKEAFALKKGKLSKIFEVPTGHMILLCVDKIPPQEDIKMETVADEKSGKTIQDLIQEKLLEQKTRIAVAEVFKKISKEAQINNYLTGDFDIAVQPASGAESQSAN